MQRWLSVFVSSTSSDLAGARRMVAERLRLKEFLASDLDSAGHAGGDLHDLIEERIQQADAVVQLIGFSSGTHRNRFETWTKYEFRLARKYHVPVFVYFLSLDFVHALGARPTDAEIKRQTRCRNKIMKSGLLCNEVTSWEDLEDRIEKADYQADVDRWKAAHERRLARSHRSLKQWSFIGVGAVALSAAGWWHSKENPVPHPTTPKPAPSGMRTPTPAAATAAGLGGHTEKPFNGSTAIPPETPALPRTENKVWSTDVVVLFDPLSQEEDYKQICKDAEDAYKSAWLTNDERSRFSPGEFKGHKGFRKLPGIEGFGTREEADTIKERYEAFREVLRLHEPNDTTFRRALFLRPF